MYTYGQELIAAKRAAADRRHAVGGRQRHARRAPVLSDVELYLFFSLLFSAGAETTRNAVAGGLLALAEHPSTARRCCGRIRRSAADGRRGDGAVDVAVAVEAAHRDRATSTWRAADRGRARRCWCGRARPTATSRCSPSPMVFDMARKPNPHLGFGQGVHYCLGANLARLEMRVMFEELLGRFTSVQVVEPVEWTRSNRHTGIRHLVVELDDRRAAHRRGLISPEPTCSRRSWRPASCRSRPRITGIGS